MKKEKQVKLVSPAQSNAPSGMTFPTFCIEGKEKGDASKTCVSRSFQRRARKSVPKGARLAQRGIGIAGQLFIAPERSKVILTN
jgi:hypothetical protein